MSNINGSTPPATNITEGEALGIGLSLDQDGDPVVLMWVSHEHEHYGVALTEDSAIALAQSLIKMASEITQMQDVAGLTPAELDAKMREIIDGVAESGPQD